MYVSYSALPPPAYSHKNSTQNYPSGTVSSHQSVYRESSLPKHSGEKLLGSSARGKGARNDTVRSNSSHSSSRDFPNVDYSTDYSNPLDHLQRPMSPSFDEYDSLDSAVKLKYQKNRLYYPHSAKYSPVARIKLRSVAPKQAKSPGKSRVFIDHVRDQPLRSFYSDPRLAVDQNQSTSERDRSSQSKRDSRPLSLYASNFWNELPCFRILQTRLLALGILEVGGTSLDHDWRIKSSAWRFLYVLLLLFSVKRDVTLFRINLNTNFYTLPRLASMLRYV